VKGQRAAYYRKTPLNSSADWPPRFMKVHLARLRGPEAHGSQFVLHLARTPAAPEEDDTLVAFLDARRLARIRLCASPTRDPPISTLGFDPLLSMPALPDFSALVSKRACTVKALLLDQTFSAGVGNWVADEILYHAHVHPEQKCNTLDEAQLAALHRWTREVCETAVKLNADDKRFPDDWLFSHRWVRCILVSARVSPLSGRAGQRQEDQED
jgi:formamidopyrimidine-DNA glycosylase